MTTALTEAKDKVRELSTKALAIVEDPKITAAEKKTALDPLEADIKHWTDEVQALDHIENKRKEFLAATGQDVEQAAAENQNAARDSIGKQFVNASGYKSMCEKGFTGNFRSGEVSLKTQLSEGTVGAPGPGYQPANIQPTILPGVVDIRFQPLTIASLLPQGTTESPLIRYLVETAVTNAAAATAEGGLMPESAISFDKADEVLHSIKTFLPITDEMLADWLQTMSYVDARLMLFVDQAEEIQLLKGDGSGENMVGLLNRSGLATSIAKGSAPSASDDNSMDAIYRQITAIRKTAFLEPDSIVIEPTAWEGIILSKNSQGAYYANGPFVGQQPQTLWGKQVANTTAMTTGDALVGAFAQAAQVFRKGGLVVEASNSHADYFQRGVTAIRAVRRSALAVYRPGAFGVVTGL